VIVQLFALVRLTATAGGAETEVEHNPVICIASIAVDGFDQVAEQLLRQKLVTDLRDAGNGLTAPGDDAACPDPIEAAAPGSRGVLTVAARRVGPTMRIQLTVRDALSQSSVLDQKLKLSTAELGRTLSFVPQFKRALAGLRRLQLRALRELMPIAATPTSASAPVPTSAPAIVVPAPDPVVTAAGASAVLTQPGIQRSDELRTWGWLAAGIGTALIAAGASTGISARIVDNYLRSLGHKSCAYIADNRWECEPDQALNIALLYALAHSTNVLLGAGGLAAIGATGLFVSARIDESAEEPPPAPAPAISRLARVVAHE